MKSLSLPLALLLSTEAATGMNLVCGLLGCSLYFYYVSVSFYGITCTFSTNIFHVFCNSIIWELVGVTAHRSCSVIVTAAWI